MNVCKHSSSLAQTHEDIWNAAQRQMARTGKMHGFMRACTGPRRFSSGSPIQSRPSGGPSTSTTVTPSTGATRTGTWAAAGRSWACTTWGGPNVPYLCITKPAGGGTTAPLGHTLELRLFTTEFRNGYVRFGPARRWGDRVARCQGYTIIVNTCVCRFPSRRYMCSCVCIYVIRPDDAPEDIVVPPIAVCRKVFSFTRKTREGS